MRCTTLAKKEVENLMSMVMPKAKNVGGKALEQLHDALNKKDIKGVQYISKGGQLGHGVSNLTVQLAQNIAVSISYRNGRYVFQLQETTQTNSNIGPPKPLAPGLTLKGVITELEVVVGNTVTAIRAFQRAEKKRRLQYDNETKARQAEFHNSL
jgi:hypothetical protein